MTAAPTVACILVNWNGWQDTMVCLNSVLQSSYQPLSIFIVDNGSTDDSVRRLQQAFPALQILQTGANLGFGAGNNRGIQHALENGADYLWLLNNDTEVRPDTLAAMVATAEANPVLGQVGSVLMYAHRPEQVQAWGGGRVNLWTGASSHFTAPVEQSRLQYLTAASVLVRATALRDVGVFDERFFMYYEDTDLSFRMRASGWQLAVCQNAVLLHREGASSGARSPAFDGMVTQSGLRFLRRYGRCYPVAVICFVLLRAFKRAVAGRWTSAAAILEAWSRERASGSSSCRS